MILIKSNQSVFDIVTQFNGDVKGALDFCAKNNLSLTQELEASTEAILPETVYKEESIKEYFLAKNQELATGYNDETAVILGIGSMIIGSNFDIT